MLTVASTAMSGSDTEYQPRAARDIGRGDVAVAGQVVSTRPPFPEHPHDESGSNVVLVHELEGHAGIGDDPPEERQRTTVLRTGGGSFGRFST